jgi:alkane 1-monooxygenase
VVTWLLYLTALVRPLLTLAFLATGPHPPPVSLLWLGSIALSVAIDAFSGREQRAPAGTGPWFDVHLYLVFLAQLAVFSYFVAALPRMTMIDAVVASVLVGVNSGYATLILAHELIHRGRRHLRWMGRALLVTCLYDHWYTEHLRAHHARFGMRSDAGTARAGESYWRFCRRSLPAQLLNAWRLESARTGWRHNRVLHGLVAELALLTAIAAWAGASAVAVVVQAAIAVGLLEAVDYFTHWGLDRAQGELSTAWSWDSESRLTLYSLLGLARHADHHLHPGRPFYLLQPHPGALKLPHGYPVMVLLAVFANGHFQRALTRAMTAPDAARAAGGE